MAEFIRVSQRNSLDGLKQNCDTTCKHNQDQSNTCGDIKPESPRASVEGLNIKAGFQAKAPQDSSSSPMEGDSKKSRFKFA